MTGDVTNNQPTVFFLGPVNNITVVPGAPLPAGGRNVADVMESGEHTVILLLFDRLSIHLLLVTAEVKYITLNEA